MVIFRLEKRERSQIQMTKQNQKSPANAESKVQPKTDNGYR